MSDPRLTDCPACEKPALQKQLTAAAFKLKGTGWYETDFKNSGKKPAPAKTDDGGGAKAEPKAETKSDTSASSPATAD